MIRAHPRVILGTTDVTTGAMIVGGQTGVTIIRLVTTGGEMLIMVVVETEVVQEAATEITTATVIRSQPGFGMSGVGKTILTVTILV